MAKQRDGKFVRNMKGWDLKFWQELIRGFPRSGSGGKQNRGIGGWRENKL
jgi:hypothetical protein